MYLFCSEKSCDFCLVMKGNTKAYLAWLFVCIVWGTTYLGIKVAVLAYPPFAFAATRQIVSGLIIAAVALGMSRQVDLSRKNLLHQMLVGFLMITLGNGVVSWAEKYVPSGVAALICSMMPIGGVIINLAISKEERINGIIGLGMLLGFGGVALIFKNNVSDLGDPRYLAGIGGLLCATFSWALGSIINKRRPGKINPVFNSGLQLLFGGLFLAIVSPFADDYSQADLANKEAFWALMYLIVFGSVLAYTAYMYALKELPVGLVMIYAYINPLVAVIVGYFWGEPLSIWTGLSFVTIISGVFIVNQGYKRIHAKKEQQKVALEMK